MRVVTWIYQSDVSHTGNVDRQQSASVETMLIVSNIRQEKISSEISAIKKNMLHCSWKCIYQSLYNFNFTIKTITHELCAFLQFYLIIATFLQIWPTLWWEARVLLSEGKSWQIIVPLRTRSKEKSYFWDIYISFIYSTTSGSKSQQKVTAKDRGIAR